MPIIDWVIEFLPLAILFAAFVNLMTGDERNPNSPAEGDRYMDGSK